MKCEPVWEYEFKKVRLNAHWHDEQLNHNSLKGVFTPIPYLSPPQSTITELRQLLHQNVTVSARMEEGHFRSRSTGDRHTNKKARRVRGEMWGGTHKETGIWKDSDKRERQTDRAETQEMMTLLGIYQT